MSDSDVVLKPGKKRRPEEQEEDKDTEQRDIIKIDKRTVPSKSKTIIPHAQKEGVTVSKPKVEHKKKIEKRDQSSFEEIPQTIKRIDIQNVKRGIERILDKNREIRPGFSYSWVNPLPPEGAKRIESYDINGSMVTLYHLPEETESYYYIYPNEYYLPIEHMKLIHLARENLMEHYPRNIQLEKPQQARAYVSKLGNKLIYSLAKRHEIDIGYNRNEEMLNVKKLSEILAKYTAGMGIVEIFLKDPYVQDIYIDASSVENRIYITLGGLHHPLLTEKCLSNISVGSEDTESLLSRFRYESGRPFSEAMPVLETDLSAYNTRATAIGKPLSPEGIAIALRRHSTDPWTLLKLIDNNTISALAAGLISFLIDGRSTILVAGSRGAGKSSLLGAIMLEFPQSQRILTIEDTLELPVPKMQELGYKVQSMSVQSSLGGKSEMNADEALRVSLRLGESAIVMGEVRGAEAKTLYEAMRAGTAGSSVLGTFHADSARAVYQRVVHDMGIPAKSFTATDIVIVAGITRPGGSQKQKRRVLQIAEIRKHESEENMFQDLMKYDEVKDAIVETGDFDYRSERIGMIANSWGMSMEECIRNIHTRAEIRSRIVEYARANNKPQLLTTPWVLKSNNTFWNLLDKYRIGSKIDYDALLKDWTAWFDRSAGYA